MSETRYTSFDNLGRLLSSEQRTPFSDTETIANATPRVFSYQYNMSGLIAETYPSGRVVRQEFDTDGDLSRVSGNAAGQTEKTYANSFNYNSSGAITSLRLGNGKWETAKYNNRLQVTEIGLGSSATDTGLLKLSYDYGTATENNGSMKTQTMVVPTVGANQGFTATQTYNYDALNRIQSATETSNNQQTWKQTFTYDRYGNRRFDANNTTTLGSCPQTVCNPLINTSDNRFSAGQGYGYDKTGNVTVDATGNQFLYDAENHQKEVKNSANQTIGLYLYDGEGKRVKKISNTETVIFVYDGGGQLTAEYSTQTVQTPQTSYLTTDHLGSPRIITNQLGAVISRKDFAAFGDETITAQRTQGLGYKPDEIRQDYTGYQKDDESGLEYAQARYYNSSHGRFTSVDPLTASANVKNPQTFNRYSYVTNSPYKFVDPLGLQLSDIGVVQTTDAGYASSLENKQISDFKKSVNEQYKKAHPELFPPIPNHEGQHGTQPEAEEPESPPSQQDLEAQLRSQFPVLSQADQATVNQAINDGQNAVSPAAPFSTILIAQFRNTGDTITPSQALENIVASTASSISVTRDANGQITNSTVAENAVYDGRTSTLLIDDDNNRNTPNITVARFFRNNSSVNAVTYAGLIFVGAGFFNQNADSRAKSIIHEAVVHKGFGRSDTDFGATRTDGSHAINAVIDRYYRRRNPSPITR